MGGRLTITSNTPVAFVDATRNTIYYTPHTSNYISLYDTVAARWVLYPFTEVSLSVAALAANVNYDVFIRRNGASFALETLAWTSDTARTVNSLTLTASRAYVRTSDNSQRYIGTIRTSAAGTVADTDSLRYVWNMDNRVKRLAHADNNVAHSYAGTTGVYRPWRNLSATSALGLSRVQFITGMAEDLVRTDWYANTTSSGGAGLSPALDSRTAPVGLLYAGIPGPTSQVQLAASANVTWNPLLGYHFVEILQGTPTGASGTYYSVSFNVEIFS
jgi:hypothetical protein